MRALWVALILTGCAVAPPATVVAKIPVAVPCVGVVPARPSFEFDRLDTTVNDGEKILALARDWPRGRAYEGKLEAVIAGCQLLPSN